MSSGRPFLKDLSSGLSSKVVHPQIYVSAPSLFIISLPPPTATSSAVSVSSAISGQVLTTNSVISFEPKIVILVSPARVILF